MPLPGKFEGLKKIPACQHEPPQHHIQVQMLGPSWVIYVFYNHLSWPILFQLDVHRGPQAHQKHDIMAIFKGSSWRHDIAKNASKMTKKCSKNCKTSTLFTVVMSVKFLCSWESLSWWKTNTLKKGYTRLMIQYTRPVGRWEGKKKTTSENVGQI